MIIKGYRKRSMQNALKSIAAKKLVQDIVSGMGIFINSNCPTLPVNSDIYKKFAETVNHDLQYDEKELQILYMGAYIVTVSNASLTNEISDQIAMILSNNTDFYSQDTLNKNPYMKKIKLPCIKAGMWEVCSHYYKPMEIFCTESLTDKSFGKFGIAEGRIEFPAFVKDGNTWMSISYSEIETMQASVEKANGKILVLGLGMGYYAYMVHIKDNVSSIDIVEKDSDVINIFQTYILPQFDHPEKIHIIKNDAYNYLETLWGGEYSFCFADIWIDAMDGMQHYLRLKHYEKILSLPTDYWLEDSIVYTMLSIVYEKILEGYGRSNMIGFIKKSPYFSKVFSLIEQLVDEIQISSPQELINAYTIEWLISTINNEDLTII